MPGVITRAGVILSMPEFTQKQKEDMAQAIAGAMVNLSHETIRKAVEDYAKSQEGAACADC